MLKLSLLLAVLCVPAPLAAQTPKVTIDQMSVKSTGTIELLLAAPPDAALTEGLNREPVSRGWLVQSLETNTGAMRLLEVTKVTLGPVAGLVILTLAQPTDPAWLNTATHTVSVTFLRSANLARAVSAPTAASPSAVTHTGFKAAPTAQAADVYFSGRIAATDKSKPKYSFEAKLQNDWQLPRHSGHLGFLAEVAADEETNADPDRINAGVRYRRVIDPRPRGSILHVQPVSVEFARKTPRTTTMLTTAHVEHVLVPTVGSARARTAVVVFAGAEIGNNFSNAIDKDNGSGFVARVRFAANPYVVLRPTRGPFKSLKGSAFWDARFLANDEIDPGRLDDRQQPTLTRRLRQYLKVDLDLAINDFVSLTIQHRWGYLPPTYKKVSATVALSLTFKGLWV